MWFLHNTQKPKKVHKILIVQRERENKKHENKVRWGEVALLSRIKPDKANRVVSYREGPLEQRRRPGT